MISVGGNIAPKKPMLQRAMTEIVRRNIGRILLISPFYKTKAWGVEDQDWFVNACMMIETELTPHQLLKQLQKIETDYGRIREQKWGPRTVDLDILLYEHIDVMDEPDLKIPHPLMTKRGFILRPLSDMMPWLAVEGKTVREHLYALSDDGVMRIEPKADFFEEILDMYWNLSPRNISLGLERMYHALQALGNPHLRLPPVIHIAGTNGKGSTSAILHKVLNAAGKRVHRYTSPHLLCYDERFIIGLANGQNRYISSDEFEIAVSRIAPYVSKYQLSHFEALTLVAFLVFADAPADYVILETGMGGRLDATNVIPNPALTIITSISFDHTEFLGDMLEAIAFEKAGIIKPNVPVVIAARHKAAQNVLREVAQKRYAPALVVEQDWKITLVENTETLVMLEGPEVLLDVLSLAGVHQLDNAGAALVGAYHLLGDKEFPEPEKLDETLAGIHWPARLQRLDVRDCGLPLPKDLDMLVDGCHNAEGLIAFVEYLLYLGVNNPKPTEIFVSFKRGRDLREVFHILTKARASLIFIEYHSADNQYTAHELAEYATLYDIPFRVVESWMVLGDFIKDPDIASKRYAVCGSLYFCGSFFRVIDYNMIP